MKYLIPAYSGLGNTIQLLVIIRSIKAFDSSASITFFSDDRFGQNEFLSCIENQNIFNREQKNKLSISFISSIRKETYDYVLLPFVGVPTRIMLMLYLSGAKRIIQHTNTKNYTFATFLVFCFKIIMGRRLKLLPFVIGRKEVDLYLDLVNEISKNKTKERVYSVNIELTSDREFFRTRQINMPYICVQVGAANGGITPKVWPSKNFKSLIELLRNKHSKYDFVLLGDKGDADLYDFNSFGPKVHNLVGKTNIKQLILLISNSEFIICHDSSVMHLGSILSKPLLAIYGPTDYERTFPKTSTSMIIKRNMECLHCMKDITLSESRALELCPNDNACMKELKPDSVFKKIENERVL